MNRFLSCLSVLGVLLVLGSAGPARAEARHKTRSLLPDLIFCGKDRNVVARVSRGKIDWEWEADGPLKDLEPQPRPGRYLVAGGPRQVFLLRKVWKGCRILWDWSQLGDISVQSAVAVDWDPKGDPTLILAADALNQRIFLAEAKSRRIKIRWEYKLPSVPERVHMCTDTGNFLVTLADSTVEEVHFQQDKVVWQVGKADGLERVVDAVRGPWAHTYVADAGSGDVVCFDHLRHVAWKTHLPFAPGDCQDMALSLYRKYGRRLLLVSVHFAGKAQVARNVLYILNTENGDVLSWSDRMEKGGYPDFVLAVPDEAEYYKKQ